MMLYARCLRAAWEIFTAPGRKARHYIGIVILNNAAQLAMYRPVRKHMKYRSEDFMMT